MIIENLKNTISRSALSGSIVQRYYYSFVPQNTVPPYAVYFILLDSYKGNDTGIKYSDIKVQFSVFSNYSDYGSQCNNILNEITNFYDNKNNVVVSGSTLIHLNRDFIIPPKYVEDVWQGVVQYTLHLK